MARAWHPTVGPASPQTLGLAWQPCGYASRKCGFRHELEQPRGGRAANRRPKHAERSCDICSSRPSYRPQRRTSSGQSGRRHFEQGMPMSARSRSHLSSQPHASPAVSRWCRRWRPRCRRRISSKDRRRAPAGSPSFWPGVLGRSRSCTEQRGLTPWSRRGPTASHQARATGTVYIFRGPGLAPCRRPRLTSNVRPHMNPPGSPTF